MTEVDQVKSLLAELDSASPAGYAIALHVSYTTPRFLFQTYPKDWMAEYSRRGMVVNDPTVKWGLENDGAIAWSQLVGEDSEGVLTAAAEHDLRFGLTVATSSGGSKSVASFARADREFDKAEAASLERAVEGLHSVTAGLTSEESGVAEELRRLSVRATHG